MSTTIPAQPIEVRFPFDRTLVVGSVAEADPAEVEAAVAAATAAFERTRRQPPFERAALLARVGEAIARRRDELAELVCLEAGKPITFARGEVDRAVSTFSFAAEEARRIGGELLPLDAAPGGAGRIGLTMRVPRGPVAAITPFNFPLNLAAHKIAPALAAGAPVIHKPALETPLSAFRLREIALAAGLEAGALAVVACGAEEAGRLVEDPRLPVLSFTGSARVGWALKARAPRKQVTLELGGNAAVVVEPDADWRAHLQRIVTGAFVYAGQVCIKAQRLLLHDSIAGEMVPALVEATRAFARAGDPRDPEVMVGPLIRPRDADRVMQWIDEARGAGGKLLCGGGRRGDLIEPTLLADVPHAAKLSCEEVFGPVAVIERYRTFDEAIALVNRSRYGLQAGVFTGDVGKIFRAFRDLEVGAVIHNDAPLFRVDQMPYGGVKDSGFGREGVRSAIEEMTEPRLLVLRP